MKPNEFDDLIRRKIDQGDFEYNAANWERLDNRMDRKDTRRKILMWLPLAPIAYISSVAASLAMIITIPVLMHNTNNNKMPQLSAAAEHITNATIHLQSPIIEPLATTNNILITKTIVRKEEQVQIQVCVTQPEVKDVAAANAANKMVVVNTWNSNVDRQKLPDNNMRTNSLPYYLYDTPPKDFIDKTSKTLISIAGGFHYGTMNGFSIGATGKRMISDRVYVEGDIAFVDNSGLGNVGSNNAGSPVGNSKATVGTYSGGTPSAITSSTNTGSGGVLATARIVSESVPTTTPDQPVISLDTKKSKYDLYYAQVTPSIGYNIYPNLSVGVGADVQQFLQSDKPLNSSSGTANEIITTDKQIPGLDLGLVGKTEVALSKTLRAGVYYRQDMSNILTSGNKYIDRSYMQVNLKFNIFRK